MPKTTKPKQTVDSDSDNENDIKEIKSKQPVSNSSKLDLCVEKCTSISDQMDNLHIAIMRIDSSSDSEGLDNSIKEYIDEKFNELKVLIIQNNQNSNNSEDEKPSMTSKSSKKESKKKPTLVTSFMTYKSDNKVQIASFKEANYPDLECFNDADGEDGKCSKRASSSKAAKYLWDQLDESEQQEYYQKSLVDFEKKYGEPYVPKEKS
jgi:hypothetical protein